MGACSSQLNLLVLKPKSFVLLWSKGFSKITGFPRLALSPLSFRRPSLHYTTLKWRLRPALEELEAVGFLEPLVPEERHGQSLPTTWLPWWFHWSTCSEHGSA